MNSKKIFLTGFMGSGKSTHGKKLASLMEYGFVDLDDYIEKKEGKTISSIFENSGEQEFRRKESECLKDVINDKRSLVISLGGGTVCFNDNITKVLEAGLLIYIKMPAEALYDRLVKSHRERPLLKNKTPEEALEFIKNTLAYREQFYSRAPLVVSGINLSASMLKTYIQAMPGSR